jgi:carboxymethylenebutenolidase
MDRRSALEGLDGLVAQPLSRRGFVMTSVISGYTLAVTPVMAQAIKTDATGLEAGEVQIPTGDGNMPGYRAMPQGAGPFPTVIVIEEIFGVHEYIKDTCRRLAKLGYCAVAPELYARQGDLTKMTDVQQIVRDVISKKPDAEMLSDLDAAVKWATSTSKGDPSRLAVTGFCRGGRATWFYAARNPSLKAAVAWYGPVGGNKTDIQPKTAGELATELKCPLLGLYGGADTGIPVADVEKARDAARAAGKTVEIVVYPDTPHAFHADYRPSYREGPAKDGWDKMLAWFKRYGVA